MHLLVAKQAPRVVILQRKRSKLFHVACVDTNTRVVEHGSWFRGKLYPLRCDVSFAGEHMVYLAMGTRGNTWNGICRLPWLTTVTEAENIGAWFGGGYFESSKVLRTNSWGPTRRLPTKSQRLGFRLEPYSSRHGGEDLGVIYERLERDGFRASGDVLAKRPSPAHPELRVRYLGYLEHGYTFEFWLDDPPDLLADASWANWDTNGTLWVARPGVVDAYALEDLRRSQASFTVDVDQFEPPVRANPASTRQTDVAAKEGRSR